MKNSDRKSILFVAMSQWSNENEEIKRRDKIERFEFYQSLKLINKFKLHIEKIVCTTSVFNHKRRSMLIT